MPETDELDQRGGLNKARFVGALLEAGGLLVGLIAAVWAVHGFWSLSREPGPTVAQFLTITALLLAGLAGGLLMWGLAEIVRKLEALEGELKRDEPRPSNGSDFESGAGSRDPTIAASGSTSQEDLVALVREVRDICLLSEEQRTARMQAQGRDLVRRLEQDVPALLREHEWAEARRRVQQARERFPTLDEWSRLAEQIEQTRSQVEARDIAAAEREFDNLASIGAWERVSDLMHDLLERHPGSVKANALARRARQERENANAKRRTRLMAQAQEATGRRDWSAALNLAGALIKEFPNSPEVEALREQLPTLRENVEIQTRQRMEGEFRELVERQHFGEALAVARKLVDTYPQSPQAQVLRDQLPRLEQKAQARASH